MEWNKLKNKKLKKGKKEIIVCFVFLFLKDKKKIIYLNNVKYW